MKLIVGLGNPGRKYEITRHNIGFLFIDYLVDEWRATSLPNKYKADLYSANIGSEKILLMKPQTYMNLSGESVGPAFGFYKCTPEDLIVIHDELDIKNLNFKIRLGGGTAGHNGLKSVNANVGAKNQNYHRIRMGIGRPEHQLDPNIRQMAPVDYVLSAFSQDELDEYFKNFLDIKKAIELIIRGKTTDALNRYNRKEK